MFPITETPDLSELAPMGTVPKTFVEEVRASWEAQRHINNFNAERHSRNEIWTERLATIQEATGVRLPHPNSFINEVDGPYLQRSDTRGRAPWERRAAYVEERIDELRQSRPEYAALIETSEVWEDRLRERVQGIELNTQDVGFVAGLAGGIGATLTDPVNVASLPFGGGSRSILRTASQEAGINALIEAAGLPLESRWRQQMGLDELTLQDGLARVGTGALFGGVFGGGGRALEIGWSRLPWSEQARALRELAPDDPDARGLADLLEREADIDAANPFRGEDAVAALASGDLAPAGMRDQLLSGTALGRGSVPGGALEADAIHREMLDWASEAVARSDLEDGNPYQALQVPPRVEPDTRPDFDEPGGSAARSQLADMEVEQSRLAVEAADDLVPTGRVVDGEAELVSRGDIEADLQARAGILSSLRTCALGG